MASLHDLPESHLHLVMCCQMLNQKYQPASPALCHPILTCNYTGVSTVAHQSFSALLFLMKSPTRDGDLQHRHRLPHSTTALSCSDHHLHHHLLVGRPCLTVRHPSTSCVPSATQHLSHCEGNLRGKLWSGEFGKTMSSISPPISV